MLSLALSESNSRNTVHPKREFPNELVLTSRAANVYQPQDFLVYRLLELRED